MAASTAGRAMRMTAVLLHDSEASTADDDDEEVGEGASGSSPLVMGRYEPDEELALDSFNWMKEVESRGTFDITDLLAEPITHIFPCVACNDQKNILDRPPGFRPSCASQVQ
jgi:hypothetical protein